MKKTFFTLLLCAFCWSLQAQSPINVGIHGGVSDTKINVVSVKGAVDGLKSSSNLGYMAGVFARVNLGPIYVEPSLNYTHKKGEVEKNIELNKKYKSSLKYTSFDVPVMFGLYVLDVSVLKIRTYLGPVASFTGELQWDKEDFAEKLKNDKTMWNGKIGVGVDVGNLTFDIDYEKGLKKFQDNAFGKIKSPRSFNFTLGFKII